MTPEGEALDLSGLTGPQRAAVLLLMLGDRYGAAVWSMLSQEEVRKVSRAMVELGSIGPETVETLIVDFISRLSHSGAITGSSDRTEELLAKIFPADQVQAILADIKGASGRRLWQRLTQTDPEVFAAFLRNEYPQTAAVILSRLSPDYAARVVAVLPDDMAADVLNRMLRLDGVDGVAMARIEDVLKGEFMGGNARAAPADPHQLMAEVFNSFDRQTEARLLSALDQTNSHSAKRIRELMFTFEDLASLDPGSIQTVLRFVDKDALGRALKGASEEIRGVFFANMSTRAAKALQEDMANLGSIRLKEAEDAQSSMVVIAKGLAAKGEIMIAKHRAHEEELVF